VLDSTSALDVAEVPRTLLVVGGGYIGLELGSVYAALGSRVTLVEMLDALLPGVDPDLVRPLARVLGERFEAIHTGTRVANLDIAGRGVLARLEGGGADCAPREFDRVLVAVGRRPASADLGFERTRVRIDEAGFVRVDGQMRTDEPTILAIGDVVGQPMLAHKAAHEARVAIAAARGGKAVFEPAAIPAVVFTDPEIAWCGLTEREARGAGREVAVARFPWAASGRSATLGRGEGLTKLVIEPGSERVLGVGIVGPGAGELIAEGVLAVEMAAQASDLELTIHPHPTLSETLMEAAGVFFGRGTHVHRPRKGGAAVARPGERPSERERES
jgi:dihydrolipoamide dehydrogenase